MIAVVLASDARLAQAQQDSVVQVADEATLQASQRLQENAYKVGKLRLVFMPDGTPSNLTDEEFVKLSVNLVRLNREVWGGLWGDARPQVDTWVAPLPGEKSEAVEIGSLQGSAVSWSALQAITSAVTSSASKKGYLVLFAIPSQSELGGGSQESGPDDNRAVGGDDTLTVELWTGRVTQTRAYSASEEPKSTYRQGVSNRVMRRIEAGSPVAADRPIARKQLDNYLYGLNRHPGRRVDASLAAVGPDRVGEVQLNYMLNETKPWTLYAQVSNTGTPETNEWRERIGAVCNQLTGRDDILQFDYITAGFDSSHALLVSYDTALNSSGEWRLRTYASASTYDASEVGQGQQNYYGDAWGLGLELSRALYQWDDLFLDGFAGLRLDTTSVDNETTNTSGEATLLIPALGLRLSRNSDVRATRLSGWFEGNMLGVEKAELDAVGRTLPDDRYLAAKGDFSHSVFSSAWSDAESPSRAHEFGVQGRFQFVFDDTRVIPTEQMVSGGFLSVRGYPESLAAGDNGVQGSFEYRLHIPQLFGQESAPLATGGQAGDGLRGFRWRPEGPYRVTDWDLIARAFVDGAYVTSNNTEGAKAGFEIDQTLASAGVGLEFSIRNNFSARVDWGIALEEIKTSFGETVVEQGDNRFHFLFTASY
jgi:hemolysin activation/secretion protein